MKMGICRNCGKVIGMGLDGRTPLHPFCPGCGAVIVTHAVCAECGASLPDDVMYCPACSLPSKLPPLIGGMPWSEARKMVSGSIMPGSSAEEIDRFILKAYVGKPENKIQLARSEARMLAKDTLIAVKKACIPLSEQWRNPPTASDAEIEARVLEMFPEAKYEITTED